MLLNPSPYSITYTDVTQSYGGASAMTTDQLAVYATNMHAMSGPSPTVGTVLGGVVISGYTVTFSDASTPVGAAISVNWGDGSVSAGIVGDRFEHTYSTAATYYIIHTASINNKFDYEFLKAVVPAAVAGGSTITVQVNDYQTPTPAGIPDVSLYLKQNGITRKIGVTGPTGGYTFTDVAAGTYDVVAYLYGMILDKDGAGNILAAPGVQTVTVDPSNPAPTITFGQTQTQFTLTVNAPAGYAISLSQTGVTKGIQKIPGVFGSDPAGFVTFGMLSAGSYSISGYYLEYDGTTYIQHSCSAEATFPGSGNQTVDCL
jgi:hypothetical protein